MSSPRCLDRLYDPIASTTQVPARLQTVQDDAVSHRRVALSNQGRGGGWRRHQQRILHRVAAKRKRTAARRDFQKARGQGETLPATHLTRFAMFCSCHNGLDLAQVLPSGSCCHVLISIT